MEEIIWRGTAQTKEKVKEEKEETKEEAKDTEDTKDMERQIKDGANSRWARKETKGKEKDPKMDVGIAEETTMRHNARKEVEKE